MTTVEWVGLAVAGLAWVGIALLEAHTARSVRRAAERAFDEAMRRWRGGEDEGGE